MLQGKFDRKLPPSIGSGFYSDVSGHQRFEALGHLRDQILGFRV